MPYMPDVESTDWRIRVGKDINDNSLCIRAITTDGKEVYLKYVPGKDVFSIVVNAPIHGDKVLDIEFKSWDAPLILGILSKYYHEMVEE
jgi:hypothetical protein